MTPPVVPGGGVSGWSGSSGVFGGGLVVLGPEVLAEVEGAVLGAEVVVAVGAGPEVGAAFGLRIGPGAVGLEAVVPAAQGCEVARTGRAAATAWGDVVTVRGVFAGAGVAGGAGAPGEHAGVAESRQ
jgi:hypothetical protein